MVVGVNLLESEIRAPGATNALAGSAYQMSFATNLPAWIVSETNLTGGLPEFNASYPTGSYTLQTKVKLALGGSKIVTSTPALTNDFPAADPVFTNVTPFMSLQTTQAFKWPAFTADPACYSRFYLLEGSVDTNLLDAFVASGIDALTNTLSVLAWNLSIPPTQTEVTVSNLNPLLDHLAVLEHHNVSPVADDPLGLSEVASVSVNATFYFALRIVAPPVSQTVEEGDVATFTVLAVGARPLNYQWQFNGADIPNATNLLFIIPEVKKSDAGDYTVVVTNPAGSKTSEAAHLTVTDATPPTPLSLSEEQMLPNGGFSFLVSGVEDGSYEIEVSTDLLNWAKIGAVTTPLGATNFVDTTTPGVPWRFYRAKSAQ